MKKFTSGDIIKIKGTYYPDYLKLICEKKDLHICKTEVQKMGLYYTASGYGNKIPTEYKLSFNNRMHRVYSRQFASMGIVFIVSKGKEIVVDIF